MAYLNKCNYTELFKDGRQFYKFTGPCVVTGKPYSVTVPAEGLWDYNHGKHMQEAFPLLSAEDREFLISGTSPEGWEETFAEMEE